MRDDEQTRSEVEGEAAERRGLEGTFFDLARKTVIGSVRSILTSEDGIRALIGAIVPKEVGQAVLREIATLRSEALRVVVGELTRYLERLDLAREVQKVLAGLRFDIHLRVEVSQRAENLRAEGQEVEARAKPKPKRQK